MSSKTKAIFLSVVVLLILFILARPLFMGGEVPLHKRVNDYDAALAQAQAAQKPVFLEFYSEY
ncbi:MAG: hypothetical protein ACYC2T_11015 [Bacillota bacterium]